MSRIITDQYTDRTDLNSHQKWALRNPEDAKAMSRLAGARMRVKLLEKDPCFYDAANRKQANKRKLARIAAAQEEIRIGIRKSTRGPSVGRRNEIIKLHSKGKSLADICVWTNTPMSIVASVIEQWKDSQK